MRFKESIHYCSFFGTWAMPFIKLYMSGPNSNGGANEVPWSIKWKFPM